MFVPPFYREPNGTWITEVIRRNPLGMMVSTDPEDGGVHATHLPVIPDRDNLGAWPHDLSDTVLLGHMNRANPHWRALLPGTPVLLVFTGPHSYVSPVLYEKSPAAPTWNFTAVHVRGILEKIDGLEETLDVVRSTARTYEADFGAGWDMTESLPYFRRIVPAVGAFRVSRLTAKGMFKLSQEQEPEVRDRVTRGFRETGCPHGAATAALMERLPQNS
jgi:transcriptional regulator